MVDSWTTFARTGEPGPAWSADRTLRLAPEPVGIGPVDDAAEHQCAGWRFRLIGDSVVVHQ
jgi:hypothetical protein